MDRQTQTVFSVATAILAPFGAVAGVALVIWAIPQVDVTAQDGTCHFYDEHLDYLKEFSGINGTVIPGWCANITTVPIDTVPNVTATVSNATGIVGYSDSISLRHFGAAPARGLQLKSAEEQEEVAVDEEESEAGKLGVNGYYRGVQFHGRRRRSVPCGSEFTFELPNVVFFKERSANCTGRSGEMKSLKGHLYVGCSAETKGSARTKEGCVKAAVAKAEKEYECYITKDNNCVLHSNGSLDYMLDTILPIWLGPGLTIVSLLLAWCSCSDVRRVVRKDSYTRFQGVETVTYGSG